MDYFFDFLLACHLVAFAVGAAAAIAMPIIGSRLATATPDGRLLLGGIMRRLGLNSRIAVAVLVLTGPIMVWERFGGFEGLGVWFDVKMALVVVLVATVIVGALFRSRINPRVTGMITGLSLLGIVIAAVLTFN